MIKKSILIKERLIEKFVCGDCHRYFVLLEGERRVCIFCGSSVLFERWGNYVKYKRKFGGVLGG